MSMAIDICFVVVRFCRNMKTNILPVIGISILGQAQAYSKLVCATHPTKCKPHYKVGGLFIIQWGFMRT